MATMPQEANFLGLPPESSGPDSRVVVLPVPFEQTSTYGQGSAQGPAALLEASREVELFDAALGFEPWQRAGGIATLPPLDCSGLGGEELATALEARVEDLLSKGRFVATLGGEHTSTVGAAWAHVARFPGCSILHLDAHSDLREEYQGNPWSHACAAARILDRAPHMVQAGIRSQAAEERARTESDALPIAYAHDIHRRQALGEDWASGVLAVLRPQVYITLDLDVFDCGLMPATGTPEPGGLDWPMLDHLFRRLFAAREVVGFDVSELAPIPSLRHPQFTAAKLVQSIIGYRFAKDSPPCPPGSA